MTFRNVYECDVCKKQEDAKTLGASVTVVGYMYALPNGWMTIRDFEYNKDIHICSKECGKKFFEDLK